MAMHDDEWFLKDRNIRLFNVLSLANDYYLLTQIYTTALSAASINCNALNARGVFFTFSSFLNFRNPYIS
jgi:hypothetical protein